MISSGLNPILNISCIQESFGSINLSRILHGYCYPGSTQVSTLASGLFSVTISYFPTPLVLSPRVLFSTPSESKPGSAGRLQGRAVSVTVKGEDASAPQRLACSSPCSQPPPATFCFEHTGLCAAPRVGALLLQGLCPDAPSQAEHSRALVQQSVHFSPVDSMDFIKECLPKVGFLRIPFPCICLPDTLSLIPLVTGSQCPTMQKGLSGI